jgi:type III secretion system FlhB-like substrate exporter
MSENAKPVPKVAAAGSGGVAATVLITIAAQFGIDLPPEVAAGIVALVAFAAGYLKR